MKKYLFKVSFIMHAFILGKDYEQRGTKHILVEAVNYDAASKILHKGMKNAFCGYQIEGYPKENKKIFRAYKALEIFSQAANELSSAWTELDEGNRTEEELGDTLTKYFSKEAIGVSFDDFAHDVSEWNRKVQERNK